MTPSTVPDTKSDGIGRHQRSMVFAICCVAVMVAMMDISIVNIALPSIRRDLHTTISGLQWTIDAYTLVLASFVVLAGSIADRVGRRRIFMVGLAVFGIGSLLCGLAPSIEGLVAARALQAVGATMLTPVALAIITTTYPDPAERAKAIGTFGSITGLALALGPILGGVLVDSLSWRAIFWINVPILAVAMLGTLLYEPRRTDPLFELRLFRSAPFSGALLMALLALCGFQGFLFVTTQYLQDVRGLAALAAGLCLLPVGGMIAVLSPFTGKLVASHGPRLPLVIAGAALVLGGAASLWLEPDTPLVAVLAIYLLFGAFLGTVNPPITNTAVAGMPRSMAGVAASLISTGRQTGTTLGVAIAGTIVGSSLANGGRAYTIAEHDVWWLILALGIGILVLGLVGTGRWAKGTAERAVELFEEVDRGA